MTTEYLRYFTEVCRCGSIQKAAKNLYISSQGLGQGIKRLEKSIGIQLLERTQTGVVPTEFGKKFFEQACAVEKEISKLDQLVAGCQTSDNIHISIGLVEKSKYYGGIQACANEFIASKPNASITYSIKLFRTGNELANGIHSGEINIGLLFHRTEFGGIEYRTFNPYSKLMLLISADHALAAKEEVHWEDLKSLRFVTAGEEDPFSSLISHICMDNGFTPTNVFYTTENNFIAGLIDSGKAAILLRECYYHSIFQFCRNAVVLPIAPEEKVADSLLIKKENDHGLLGEFSNYLLDYLKSIIR